MHRAPYGPAADRGRDSASGRHPYLIHFEETLRTRGANAEDGALPDYYGLLGVARGATGEQVESAYRRYVRMIHPDQFFKDPRRRAEAEERLKAVNAAMQMLRDPAQRARYDAALDHLPLASRLGPPGYGAD